MKSTIDQLSANEKMALAALYSMDGYGVLKKIHNIDQMGLGQDALSAPNMEHVKFLQGRMYQSKATIELIRNVYRALQDDERKKRPRSEVSD